MTIYARAFRSLLALLGCLALLGLLSPSQLALAHVASNWKNFSIKVSPHYRLIGKAGPHLAQSSCLDTGAQPECYNPFLFQQAYAIAPLLKKGITGKGRTIVILDWFQSPTIVHDLQLFDKLTKLPDPTFHIFAPNGLTPFDPNNPDHVSEAAEITLDVEWAHVVAPGATIDLVLAKTPSLGDLLNATNFAVTHNLGDIISQSFGVNEACVPQYNQLSHRIFQAAIKQKVSLFAAAGDSGAAVNGCNGNPARGVLYPASDPSVTAAGGTSLRANGQTGSYIGETTWNDTDMLGSTGGGFSGSFARPSYQNGMPGIQKTRGLPDISFDSDPETGVLVLCSSCGQGADAVLLIGGTSAASPELAGVAALADQIAGKRLGQLNGAIYALGKKNRSLKAFHDITKGNNTVTVNGQVINGYSAGKGWDAVTGWGSPIVSVFAPQLAALLR